MNSLTLVYSNNKDHQKKILLKVPGTKSAEDYVKEVTRLTQEHFPNFKITEALTRKVLMIFQDNHKMTIIECKGKAPSTYSHSHQKIKYHIKLGGIFLLIKDEVTK